MVLRMYLVTGHNYRTTPYALYLALGQNKAEAPSASTATLRHACRWLQRHRKAFTSVYGACLAMNQYLGGCDGLLCAYGPKNKNGPEGPLFV